MPRLGNGSTMEGHGAIGSVTAAAILTVVIASCGGDTAPSATSAMTRPSSAAPASSEGPVLPAAEACERLAGVQLGRDRGFGRTGEIGVSGG